MKTKDKIQFYEGIPDPTHLDKWFKPTKGGLLMLDDLMAEGSDDKHVLDLFTRLSSSQHYRVVPHTGFISPW